jgi:hypothetical protein
LKELIKQGKLPKLESPEAEAIKNKASEIECLFLVLEKGISQAFFK